MISCFHHRGRNNSFHTLVNDCKLFLCQCPLLYKVTYRVAQFCYIYLSRFFFVLGHVKLRVTLKRAGSWRWEGGKYSVASTMTPASSTLRSFEASKEPLLLFSCSQVETRKPSVSLCLLSRSTESSGSWRFTTNKLCSCSRVQWKVFETFEFGSFLNNSCSWWLFGFLNCKNNKSHINYFLICFRMLFTA